MILLERFEAILRDQKFIKPKDTVFVACSGGPDSVSLFYLLRLIQKKWNLKLGLLHFNHGMRGPGARRDERFVRNLAKKSGVPVYCGKKKVIASAKRNGQSLEEAARKVRYDFLSRAGRRYRISKIALAHTLEDQAETVLMRILQGTGMKGLSAIRPAYEQNGVCFIRPLLEFRKKELLGFLKSNRISYCIDESNRASRFLRNRIRLKLLPWLEKEFNPQIQAALARIPATVHEDNEWLADLEKEAWQRVYSRRVGTRIYLKSKTFFRFPLSLRYRVLNRAVQELDPRSGINFAAWQRLKQFLQRKTSRSSLPRDIDINVTPSHIKLYKKFYKR